MQTDNAKQGSGLKKIAGWTIGTIAAWAVTKMFDSYYDVSLFSSMYAAVGAWLGQTIPVHLWLFWVVVAVSALAGALGVWSFLIKRLEVGAAEAERDKAYEKAREVIEKNKAANKKLEAAELELKITRKKLEATESELTDVYAKIADLETPKVQPLTESHHIVLAGIEIYDNADKECYVKDLSQKINFTMVQTEGAIDVLLKRKLVNEWYTNGGRSVSLTPDGRAYVLDADFDMSHLPL
ncbi:hypothetical protein V0M98_24420 [Pseudomonas silesiensis]|uniref:hypothetical protein n=1 Tax=Pseudomonas silesiensis TaxID=1853130 RepID=UPI0030D22F8F